MKKQQGLSLTGLIAVVFLLLDFNPSSAASWYELNRRP